jgi:hypothetical protein
MQCRGQRWSQSSDERWPWPTWHSTRSRTFAGPANINENDDSRGNTKADEKLDHGTNQQSNINRKMSGVTDRSVRGNDDKLGLALTKSFHGRLVTKTARHFNAQLIQRTKDRCYLNLPDFMTSASFEFTPSRFFFCSHTI